MIVLSNCHYAGYQFSTTDGYFTRYVVRMETAVEVMNSGTVDDGCNEQADDYVNDEGDDYVNDDDKGDVQGDDVYQMASQDEDYAEEECDDDDNIYGLMIWPMTTPATTQMIRQKKRKSNKVPSNRIPVETMFRHRCV